MTKYPVCCNKIKDPECAAKMWHSQINYKTKEKPGGGWGFWNPGQYLGVTRRKAEGHDVKISWVGCGKKLEKSVFCHVIQQLAPHKGAKRWVFWRRSGEEWDAESGYACLALPWLGPSPRGA